jgi:hypothetical protein
MKRLDWEKQKNKISRKSLKKQEKENKTKKQIKAHLSTPEGRKYLKNIFSKEGYLLPKKLMTVEGVSGLLKIIDERKDNIYRNIRKLDKDFMKLINRKTKLSELKIMENFNNIRPQTISELKELYGLMLHELRDEKKKKIIMDSIEETQETSSAEEQKDEAGSEGEEQEGEEQEGEEQEVDYITREKINFVNRINKLDKNYKELNKPGPSLIEIVMKKYFVDKNKPIDLNNILSLIELDSFMIEEMQKITADAAAREAARKAAAAGKKPSPRAASGKQHSARALAAGAGDIDDGWDVISGEDVIVGSRGEVIDVVDSPEQTFDCSRKNLCDIMLDPRTKTLSNYSLELWKIDNQSLKNTTYYKQVLKCFDKYKKMNDLRCESKQTSSWLGGLLGY